jgi:amino acid adenylation domain-containing protein
MKREEELAYRRAGLSEAKRARLAERLQRSSQYKTPYASIKRREADQKMVLSFAQQRLWFLDQLAPGNPFYNMPMIIQLDGFLDVPLVLRCLQELAQRHESLRTNFVMDGDEPVQVVTPSDRLSLPMIDLQELPEEQQRLTVQHLSEIEAQRPFDLSRDPLMRSTLLRRKPQKHILLMTMHHIISDGWSMGILYHEMIVLYQALREGAASPLSPLPLQYADYAIFQHEWLQGELQQKQMAYWREQLANLTPLNLPLDHPRPPRQTFHGSVLSFTLSPDLVRKIQALCQQEGITLFIILLSAFQMLLARYTGSDDIAVGTPIAGRTKVELEGLVGFFVNTLVIRTNLSGNPSLRGILHTVRNVAEVAFNHQDVPFEKLVEELQPERSLSQSPLIQTLFTLKVPIDNMREIAGLRLHTEEQESQTTQFDLMLTMSEVQDDMVGQFQYDTNLFDKSTIQRLVGRFSALLRAIVDTPQQTLWETPILSDEEQRKILYEWNATETGGVNPPLQDVCLHQLVERQVEQTPDSVALVFEGETLTYAELNQRANQLAHYLQRLGVGPDVFVAVCLSLSIEMVVGLLAVLKAGGAYVPLDPSYSGERLAWMLTDTQPVVVLTQTYLTTVLPQAPAQFICLDADWQHITGEPSLNLACQVVSQNLAYVIYTSGSTGRPKGVMNTHRGICNTLLWCQQAYQLTGHDALLQRTGISFDPSLQEMLWPLIAGARLVIAHPQRPLSTSYLLSLLTQEAITVMETVPSLLQVLLSEEPDWHDCQHLRLVICGGETLSSSLQNRFLTSHHARLQNHYGPTEAAIDVMVWSCQSEKRSTTAPGLAPTDSRVPIGRPIAQTQVYLLDSTLQPVPIGVPAELYIGGVNLARGYLNRTDLTAERFLPHPWSSLPGERLYRTGDLARYRPDGAIEYLGRLDSQVKLRGFRIELGEIEATLQAHPAVEGAVVMMYEKERIGPYLAAYVAPVSTPLEGQGEVRPTQEDLQSYLRDQLPDYMVPTVIVSLQSLPLTQSGKVNRKALPVPERTAQSQEGYVAPQSELEQRLAEIWQQVLGTRTPVGVYENFFDLGGHSLLLIQVRSKLEALLDYEVPVVDLFQYPTIHALSTYLSGHQEQQALFQPIAERVRKRKGALSTKGLQTSHDGIAIVGLAGRFPGARNLDEFWQNLCHGVESISFFSEEDLLVSGIEPELLQNPRYVKAHGILDDVESFDAAFFGYSPKEAALMDPQQRLFLECAWEALEQAGVIDRSGSSDTYQGPIGVYAGQSASSYLFSNVLTHPTYLSENGAFSTLISNEKDFLATRTSYKLGLEGPGMTIQTACSTSLVAVHMACQGLLRYECDMALAGGASIVVPQKGGYLYEEEGILSPDGHCRAFDADARGTVAGSGVGIVALKRLSDALTDGDTIYAVIRGSAINNDGATKVGYTAPSIKGQVNVIAEAMAMAGVEPESISYVETHGTGTALGDPIEIAALTQAFRAVGKRTGAVGTGLAPVRVPTAIGSVKTNIGHLDAVAGIAGLIKTVLSLKHGMLPPSLHYHHPNPKIDFAHSPFYVNTHLKPWKRGSTPHRAGVSSFGIGGTNAHVILEEAPATPQPGPNSEPHVVVLSAKTASALETMTERLATYVKAHPEASLADMAYTLQMGRKSFPYRRAFVARSRTHMLHLLETLDPESVSTDFVPSETKQVAFLFPGQGSQYVNMGRELYETEPAFRDQIDICARLLAPHLHSDLREIIYPETGEGQSSSERHKDEEAQDGGALHQTGTTQPALFVIEYALAQLLMKWGIHPQAMIGHSIGEYVAACLAGVFSLPDALALVALRGRMMQALPVGAMLTVMLSEKEVEEFLEGEKSLTLAACNGAYESVVSGSIEAIERLEKHLMDKGISCLRVQTSHASHSQMMEPIIERFTAEVSKVALHPPKIPYISNVTGIWITDQEATNPAYWAQHLRQTVRFHEGMQHLLASPAMIMLEVGPGHALSTLARWAGNTMDYRGKPDGYVLSSLRHPQTSVSDRAFLLNTCGRLWCAGVAIDWSQLYVGGQRRRLPLPTYPFERERYWTLPVGAQTGGAETGQQPRPAPTAPVAGYQENASHEFRREPDMAQWFSVPSWKLSPLPALPVLPDRSEQKACWLIFADTLGLGTRLVEHLVGKGQAQGTAPVATPQGPTAPFRETVITVRVGTRFQSRRSEAIPDLTLSNGQVGPDGWEYTLRPECREDYDSLLNDMRSSGLFPTHIIHMWMVIAIDQVSSGLDYLETAQTLGFYSLLFLTQALGRQKGKESQEVFLISNNLQEVIGREVLCPGRATALGVSKIAPYEYPHISFRSIDIVLPATLGQAQGTVPTAPIGQTQSTIVRSAPGRLSTPTDEEQLVDQMIAELRSGSSDLVVAYRGPHRWVRCVEPVRLEKVSEEKQILGRSHGRLQGKTQGLRQQGVYLITGGLGGIGLSVAEDLACRVRARLVLIGRSALPAREAWDRMLALANEPDAASGQGQSPTLQAPEVSKIRQIRRMEELGAEVLVIQADVTDLGQMQTVIQQVHQRFGQLHGVIHTAGIIDEGLIQMRRSEVAAKVLAPKVRGTLVLEAVLKGVPLDFLVLFSSLAALIGELGRVDYCAANTFLDSFAFYHMAQRGVRTISIDWDGWREVGMTAKDPISSEKVAQSHPELQMRPGNVMSSQEGVEAFGRIIAYGTTPQLIVSTSNILVRLRRAEAYLHSEWSRTKPSGEPEPTPVSAGRQAQSTVPTHRRPHLQTAYVPPQNETQQRIADLWQNFLGIEKIGIHDNFIDLGGNSLLATQLITRLRDMFQVDLTLRTLFDEPTIARLAMLLVNKKAELIDAALLLQDIENVEHLTDDEVQALLAADSNQTERTQNR